MRLNWFVVLLSLTFASYGQATSVDWAKLKKLSETIQSSVTKADLDELVRATVEILTITPTKTNYYSIGYSTGEENVIFLNHANALTGDTMRIPLNPFRRIQTDCIYVPSMLKGMVVLYNGRDTTRSLCELNKVYLANPSGYKPLFSRSDKVVTTTSITHNSDHQTILDAENYAKEYPHYPYALDPHGFSKDHVRGRSITFVAGYFLEEKDTNMHKFVPKLIEELSYAAGRIISETILDEWDACVKCEGKPKEYLKTHFLA